MIKAIYPGSFDPITVGHLDIIRRSTKTYDRLVVAVMENRGKSCIFTPEERKAMIEKCVEDLDNVEVVIGSGLTINIAEELGCKIIVRGIRAVSDYEAEMALASANMKFNENIETIIMVAKPELSFLSSSIAKEIAYFGGDISAYIPSQILKEVQERLCN